MKVILIGPPGAGKGTQAAAIKEKYPVAHISTGDILRAGVREGTKMGREAQKYMDAGKLVPDDLMINMMKDRLAEEDARAGFLLDGFPRTAAQAVALDALLDEMTVRLDAVVLLEMADEDVVNRLSNRRVCISCGAIYNSLFHPPVEEGVCDLCGECVIQRDDDRETVIRNRLTVYHSQTAPLIEYYEKHGVLHRVDGSKASDEVRAYLETLKGIK
jgi:adenylate kinase